MTREKAELRKLVYLADIVLEKELEKLSGIGQAAAALERSVRDLDEALYSFFEGAAKGAPDFASSFTGYTQNWQRWRRQKRAELIAELAATRAEQEKIRNSARVAFGRVQALRRISADT